MKKIIPFLLMLCSFSVWSQTNSNGGTTHTSGNGGGPGLSIEISSLTNSDSIEILPNLSDANVVGYKVYNSNLELKKDITIQPTNNQTITISDLSKDLYYIQLILDREVNSTQIINKQFLKE